MATYYYDYVAGNNGNAGTEIALPKKYFGTNVTLIAGDRHLFKRGITWSGALNEVRIGIVGCTGGSAANPAYLGAYGTGEKPIINGVNNTEAALWVRHGSHIVIEDLQFTGCTKQGVNIRGASAAQNPTNITMRRCVVFGNNTTNTNGIDGITVSKITGAALTTGVVIEDCIAYSNNGHGIKARNGASETVIRRCVAYNNGLGTPAHGIGSAATRVVQTGWSLVGGTIYQATLTPANYDETAAITALDAVWTSGPTYYSLVNAGTTATPALGEFSVPANNTLYVNVGDDPALRTVEASKNPPLNTLIEDCEVYGTIDFAGGEGHGFASDDFSVGTIFRRCYSHDNDGYSFTFNKNGAASLLSCVGDDVRGVWASAPTGTLTVSNNTIFTSDDTYPCLRIGEKGNVIAKNNVFVGGVNGILTGSSITDTYTESNNCYYAQAAASIKHGATTPAIDATSLTTDPLLTSDYRPIPSSPLIGAGTHLGYTRDVERKQRPNPPSIGAYDVATLRTA